MTRVVRYLLFSNIAVFFLEAVQPGLVDGLAFVPQLVLFRPWTIVTYMFLHGGLAHIGFNMLALFFFGPRVEERIGSQRFATLYFLSGVSGALVSLAFSTAPIIGASAGVFGVMLAFAHFWPDAPIMIWGIFPVPARILVIITTVLALFSIRTGANSGVAHFAHLGGYAGAWLYMRWLERSRAAFKRRAISPTPSAVKRLDNWKSVDLSKVHEVNREQLNRILDKIAASGLGSLTEQERLFLSNFMPAADRPPTVH